MDFADNASSTLGAHKDTMDRKFTDFQKHGAHERHMEDSRPGRGWAEKKRVLRMWRWEEIERPAY